MISDVNSDDAIHIIDASTTISVGNNVLFEYNHHNGELAINIAENFFVNLNIGEIPVDLCFPIPGKQSAHYCFKNVSKIIRIANKDGLVKRFTRFFRRK